MWQGSGLTGEGRNMPRKIESSAKTARAGDKKTKQGMNILFVSSEAVPFSKSGGLADVCGALPKALAKRGHDVRVVIPRYWCISRDEGDVGVLLPSMGVPMGGETVWCQVLEGRADGVKYYFVEHQNFFGRSGLYDDGKWEYQNLTPITPGRLLPLLRRAAIAYNEPAYENKLEELAGEDWKADRVNLLYPAAKE